MTRLFKLLIVLCLSGLVCAAPVQAQAPGNPPPALAAAVMSGNPNAVAQAIRSLSGGNPLQAANLVVAALAFAEKQLAANPGAGAAALGALALLQDEAVLKVAPGKVADALAVAERIIANPNMQTQPDAAAKLAAEVLRVRSRIGPIANGPAPAPVPAAPLNEEDKVKDAPQEPPAEDAVVQQVIDQAADQAAAQAILGAVEEAVNQNQAVNQNIINPAPCSSSSC